MTEAHLASLDLVVIGVYFTVVLGIGVWVAKRTSSGEDLFLAGRSLTWGFIGFSLFASNISSTTLIGLTGDAYRLGISVSNYEWMAGVMLVLAGFFLIPIFIRSKITTIPELLEKRYDGRSRTYFSAVVVISSILIDTAGGIYAGAVVLRTFFPELLPFISDPNLDFIATCAILALVAGLYTAAGGLAAVVYTDVLQAVVLIVGSTVTAGIVFSKFGFSWSEATSELPEGHLSLVRPLGEKGVPWLGTLIGVPIIGLYYWALNQYIVQRVLGAKDVSHARWGAMLGGALKLLPLFIMVLPGALAYTLFPDIERSDAVFPTLVSQLLPPGILGLVLAGLVAAIMSSIDSTLSSASTLISVDFIKKKYPDLSNAKMRKIGSLVTIGLMVAAAAWAPVIRSFPGLWSYIQAVLSYLIPPVVAVFVVGLFWRRANATAAFATLIGGHALSVMVFLCANDGLVFEEAPIQLHFTIICGILTAVCTLAFVALSFALGTRALREDQEELVWTPAVARPANTSGWLSDFRLYSAVVLILTAGMLVVFW